GRRMADPPVGFHTCRARQDHSRGGAEPGPAASGVQRGAAIGPHRCGRRRGGSDRTNGAGPWPSVGHYAAHGPVGSAVGRGVMSQMPFTTGPIHFVGIGGIGMSGIAEVMHNLGYQVQGSDISDNANVRRLRSLGIEVMIGQRAENLGDARVVVISSAVKADNPEVVAARAALLPVVRRAEMLAELMRLKWC